MIGWSGKTLRIDLDPGSPIFCLTELWFSLKSMISDILGFSMETMGTPWDPMGTPWGPMGPMGTHGFPWEPMGTHGNPWESMGIDDWTHGNPLGSNRGPIGRKTEKPKIQETLHKSGPGLIKMGFW